MPRMVPRTARALLLAIGLVVLLPAVALAHPLGNFTVNHYAGIRVEPTRIVLDVVIDEAEIPTFQARLTIDTNGDGVIEDSEAEVERLAACPRLVPNLELTAAGAPLTLVEFGAGLSFPPGTAGLSTMRLVCEFSAILPAPLEPGTRIGFNDTSHPGRIGWHEVVVSGSGVTLGLGGLPTKSVSNRLRLYPANLIPHPLAVNDVTFTAGPGRNRDALRRARRCPAAGPAGVARAVGPADGRRSRLLRRLSGAAVANGPAGSSPDGAAVVAGGSGAVPGGVVGLDIAGLVGTSAITPLVLLASLLAALLLGAGHALTPGHGKTLMGAYLVGSRGSAIHAAALGLSVAVSHTLGIIVLAAVILQARDVAPELFNTIAPVASGLTVVAIGTWLLIGQARAWRARRTGSGHDRGEDHDHDHEHEHEHGSGHDHVTITRSRRPRRSAGAACSCSDWPAG